MTWCLTGSILAVYIWQLLGQRHGIDLIGGRLAVGPEAMAAGRYWTFLTYAWAHAIPLPTQPDWVALHLVTNVFPLFCIGPVVERWRGPWVFLALYVGGAIAAALAWYVFQSDPRGAMIGASGAVFALFTAAGTLGIQLRRVDFIFFTPRFHLDLRTAAVVLTGVEVAQLFFRGLPEISHIGHLGGAVFGVIFALLAQRLSSR